jgi:hypothetical protein
VAALQAQLAARGHAEAEKDAHAKAFRERINNLER